MKKLLLAVLIGLVVSACCNQTEKQSDRQHFSYGNLSEVGVSEKRVERIDSLMNEWVKNGLAPNVVTFIARGGKVIHNKAYGFSNIEDSIHAKTDDIYRWASQSKAVISVALMTLFERGYFLLDEPISKWLPEFANPQVFVSLNMKDTTAVTRPAAREITVRDLLSHRSGIGYGTLWGNPTYLMSLKADIPNVCTKKPYTIEEGVKKIATIPLSADPGTRFIYGLNTDVIGRLIEVMSGKPLDVFMKETIFDPLGMKDTYFYLPEEKASRLVKLYSKDNMESPFYLATNDEYQTFPISGAKTYFCGGAGLVGTAEDFGRFAQMLLNGGTFNNAQILSPKTIKMMTKNQGDSRNDGGGFGLGFEIYDNNADAYSLASPGTYKWGGMYGTDYLIDPQEDMVMTIMLNVHPYANPDLHQRFRIIAYQTLFK